MVDFKKIVRDIPDFPENGILFRDITPVLLNPNNFREAVDKIGEITADISYDCIAGPESRGFIFGAPLAYAAGKGFIPVRKAGKLPWKTVHRRYSLEYGEAEIEIHEDAIKKGDKVLIVDDLLATGGTCAAICGLIEEMGGIVAGCAFFIELAGLNGRALLPVKSELVRSVLVY